MKTCVKCGSTKELDEFPKRSSSVDGRRAECKSCKNRIDSERWHKKMSDPANREQERLRVRLLQEKRTEYHVENRRQKDQLRHKTKRDKKDIEFLSLHGCTRKEFKRREAEQEFVSISKSLNGEKYDYSEVFYQGVWTPVKIWCSKHQEYFTQTPKDHKVGRGCPKCGKEATGAALRKSQEQFITDAKNFCGDKYTYENVVYVDNKTPVSVTCKDHGDFPIRPGNLLSGKGCPGCALYGYSTKRSGTLYVLKSENITKIGITNKTVDFRLKQINKADKNFTCSQSYQFENGAIPQQLETVLLKELRTTHNQPTEIFDGSTECFYDVDHDWLLSRIEQLIKEFSNDS